MRRFTTMMAVAGCAAFFALQACETAPSSSSDRQALVSQAGSSIRQYRSADPTLAQFFDTSYGYAVFPSVGSGAFIVGGSFGRGVVYEQSVAVGFADIRQGSVGLQAGGQGFSQIIFFQTRQALNEFKSGRFSLTADANAVAVEAGAAAQTTFQNGVAVFIQSQSGLMASAAVGGQKFNFVPFVGGEMTQAGN